MLDKDLLNKLTHLLNDKTILQGVVEDLETANEDKFSHSFRVHNGYVPLRYKEVIIDALKAKIAEIDKELDKFTLNFGQNDL